MTSPLAGFLREGEFSLSVRASQPLESKVSFDGMTADCVVALFGSREARSELGLIVLKKGRVLGKLKPLLALPVTRELSAVEREQGLELRWKEELCCQVHMRSPILSDLVTSRIAQMTRYQHDPFSPGSCTHKWIWHYADLFPKALQTGVPPVLKGCGNLMPEHYDSEIMDTFIRQQLRLRQSDFTKVNRLTLFAGTWNCGGSAPRDTLRKWLLAGKEPDLIVLALQETCKLKAASTLLGDSERSQLWRGFVESEVSAAYPQAQYVSIESFSLVGMLLVVLGKASLYPFIPREETDACLVKCGLNGRTGNKGGIGVRFRVFDTTVCVVNCHLAAFTDSIQERNAQFNRIACKLSFRLEGRPVKVYEHDVVLWLGDLNYRLSNLTYADILASINAQKYQLLLEHDQLRQEIRKKCAFADFQEAEIVFPPTYKFRLDSSNYADGDNRREPAWCDRILWRGDMTSLAYSYVPEIKQSDHRPVYALFSLPAKTCDLESCRRAKMDILRLIDSAHHKCQPQVQLSSTLIRIPGLGYKQWRSAELIVASACPCMVKFKFKSAIKDKVAKSWLKLSPEEGAIAPGESAIVTLTAFVDEKAARKVYWDPDYLNCVLVLSVVGGSDYFVDVQCDYLQSSFGSSCYDLVKVFEPINSTKGKPEESGPELPVPKELWRMLEYIVDNGAQVCGLFSETGTPEGLDEVRQAVDSDRDFGPQADVYSACSVLLEWLHSLSVPVLPLALLDCFCNLYIKEGRTNAKLAEGFIESLPPVAGRCFVAILAFLKELLEQRTRNRLSKLVGLFTEALTQAGRVAKQAHELTEEEWNALQLRRTHRYCFISLYFL